MEDVNSKGSELGVLLKASNGDRKEKVLNPINGPGTKIIGPQLMRNWGDCS